MDLSELCAKISGGKRVENGSALFTRPRSSPRHRSLCHFPSLSCSLANSPGLFFFFPLQGATPAISPPLPFSKLFRCLFPGSKVRRGWQDSLRRCLDGRRRLVGALGTWMPLLSPGWHRGSEPRCTVQKIKKNKIRRSHKNRKRDGV